MWFLNKETGIRWEVSDLELIKRLESSDHYERIEDPKASEAIGKATESKQVKSKAKES